MVLILSDGKSRASAGVERAGQVTIGRALDLLTDVRGSKHTHFSKSNNAMSSFDRIYVTWPSSKLCNLKMESRIIWNLEKAVLHHGGSDHAPVLVSIAAPANERCRSRACPA